VNDILSGSQNTYINSRTKSKSMVNLNKHDQSLFQAKDVEKKTERELSQKSQSLDFSKVSSFMNDPDMLELMSLTDKPTEVTSSKRKG
jgi:hypothetical protein